MRWYFQWENQSENHQWNPSRAKVWSIFGHLALPRNTQKSLYQNTHLWQIPCQVYEPVLSMGKSKWKPSLKPIQSKSLEHLWPLGIVPQHSKVPVPKYSPMTNPLSSLWAGTFNGKIKEKTIIETHPEQKFGASLDTWHCTTTLKSPPTNILTYEKSLVMFMSSYLHWKNQSENHHWNPSRAKVWSIFSYLALPRNTQKSPYQNTHLK